MAQPLRATVSESELAALLRLAAVTPGQGSPLPEVPADYRPDQASLYGLLEKGVTDSNGRLKSAWVVPLAALAAPRSRLSLTLIGPTDELAVAEYYVVDDTVVSWANDGDQRAISYPIQLRTLHSVITAWLGTAAVTESASFSDTFSQAEFTAFVAIVDAYREERLRAFAERRVPGNSFDLAMLRYQIAIGSEIGDSRWLAGVIARYGLWGLSVDFAKLEQGLSGLHGRGWIAPDEGRVGVLESFAPICEGLGSTLPCVSLGTDGAAGVSSILAVHGRDAYWWMGPVEGNPPGIRLLAVNGPELARVLEGHLRSLLPQPAPVPQAAAPSMACSNCGTTIAAGAAFCAACGQPVRPAAAAAAPQRPAMNVPPPPLPRVSVPASAPPRAAVSAPARSAPPAPPPRQPAPSPRPAAPPPPRQAAPPPPPVAAAPGCAACGAQLKPGKRFCIACGAPVGG